MKSFLKELLLFFFLWSIITGCIDIYYTKHLKTQHIREIETWERIFGDSIDADIFILGSSRAMSHYIPSIIDSISGFSCYNFGLDGKKIDSDIMLYNILKKHIENKPKYLIWDISLNGFSFSSKYGDQQYTPYLFNSEIWGSINKDSIHFTLADKYIPLLRYWRKQVFPHYNALLFADNGYVNLNEKWSPQKMIEAKQNPIEFKIEPIILERFRQTIRELKSNGAKVILVVSPLYYEGMDCILNSKSLIDSFQTYASEENCLFYNFTNDSICHDTSLFYNAWHLNETGAKLFSNKIALTIDSLGTNGKQL